VTGSTSRSIPSLDGLRAVSVALVIFSHSLAYIHGEPRTFPFTQISELGKTGVDVFFVISGFLITGLLLKEAEAPVAYRLKRFYLRRFFRIFPPFYLFLGVAWIVLKSIRGPLDYRDFATAATYTYNYLPHSPAWLLTHIWSLSLEEQFYILWPPLLLMLGKEKSAVVAIAAILISPALRFFTYVLAPVLRGNEAMMLHTRLDTIMFGCAMALLWTDDRFNRWVARLARPSLVALSIVYIAIVSPFLSTRFRAHYDWTVGFGLEGVFISIVMIYVVRAPSSGFGRFLNWKAVRHIGVISYGIYLWQQMFTGPYAYWFPLNLIAILACAELSYWSIERWASRARDCVEKRYVPRPPTPDQFQIEMAADAPGDAT
jgi:peptidoglycan/LPS O-acetylase OafA/YrhL